MRKRGKKAAAAFLGTLLALGSMVSASAAFADFTDVQDHWAKDTLQQAYEKGLMSGSGPATMAPNDSITTAQAVTILCRVLNVTGQADISDLDIPPNAWYRDYAAKAIYAGLLDKDMAASLNEPITRGDAFCLFGRAFQVVGAAPDLSVLDAFSDTALLTGETQRAAAALVSRGVVSGVDGGLQLQRNLTRGEFATILFRLADEYTTAYGYGGQGNQGAVLSGNAALNGLQVKSLWLDQSASNVSLLNMTADLIVVRSEQLESFQLDGTSQIGILVLAAKGDVLLKHPAYCQVDTLVVAEGNGKVDLRTDIPQVEVTGSGRTVELSGNLDRLMVSGSGNTITLAKGCTVKDIAFTGGNNTLKLDGKAESLLLSGRDNKVNGGGRVDDVTLHTQHYQLNVSKGNVTKWTNFDISGVELKLNAPSALPAGETLRATARLTVPEEDKGKLCTISWYLNGECMQEQKLLLGQEDPVCAITPNYTHDLKQDAELKAVLTFENTDGDRYTQEDSDEIYLDTFADLGLADAVITVSLPEQLAAGETLTATAAVETPGAGQQCTGHWYVDGKEVATDSFVLGGGPASLSYRYDYYYGMPETSTVTYALTYTTQDGREQKVDGSASLALENFEDNGIARATVSLNTPGTLPAGQPLEVTANINYPEAGKHCIGEWYVDGNKVSTQNILLGQDIPRLSHTYTYTETMNTASTIRFVLSYTTLDGRAQQIEATSNLTLENYDYLYYHGLTAEDVLRTVTSRYAGNYTFAWAANNDYPAEIKKAWVNLKGYSSQTEYLVWVNLTYQRVNIFTGSQGNWDIARCCLCASGKASTATPRGVYTTSYKQSYWNYGSYYCGPIVRFNGTSGLAFHSRLQYWPMNSDRYYDASIGYPVSHGCLRMYNDDIWYMYNNIPSGTTVVVY